MQIVVWYIYVWKPEKCYNTTIAKGGILTYLWNCYFKHGEMLPNLTKNSPGWKFPPKETATINRLSKFPAKKTQKDDQISHIILVNG